MKNYKRVATTLCDVCVEEITKTAVPVIERVQIGDAAPMEVEIRVYVASLGKMRKKADLCPACVEKVVDGVLRPGENVAA